MTGGKALPPRGPAPSGRMAGAPAERLRVAVRVRPLLTREVLNEEVVAVEDRLVRVLRPRCCSSRRSV